MSFISKLKPRIKPRLGIKVGDTTPLAHSTDANIQSSSASSPPTSVYDTSAEDAATIPPTSSLEKSRTAITAPEGPGITGPRITDSVETVTTAEKSVSNEGERPTSKVSLSPGSELPVESSSVDQKLGKLETPPDSTEVNKPKPVDRSESSHTLNTDAEPKGVIISEQKKIKPRIMGLKQYKPVIKKQFRPNSSPDNLVSTQPTAILENQTINENRSTEPNHIAAPCVIENSFSCPNNSESKLDFSTKNQTQELQNGGHNDTVITKPVTLQEAPVPSDPQDITPSSAAEETTTKELDFQDNQVKCVTDPSKNDFKNIIHKPDVIKKHTLIKRPPKILRKAPKLDRSRSSVLNISENPPPTTVAPENVSLESHDGDDHTKISTVENGIPDEHDVENVSYNNIPIIDTTKSRNQTSNDVAPLSTVSSNTDNMTSRGLDKNDLMDECKLPNKSTVDEIKSASSPKGKSSKTDTEDVRTLCAISAVDYLRRHDHALGDSVIRRLIIGDKNMKNRNLKATMCSSCNPQTLQKCLASLWSFHKDELQVILKKSAERQKAPMTYANYTGKPLFKPSLGRQRAPTLTASTYGKMCFEVKEGLAKKYGPKAPELSKLRMLDLIFYNPSDNPMSKPSSKTNSAENSPNTSSSSSPSASTSSSRKTSIKEGSAKSSDLSDSDPDDPEEGGGSTKSTGSEQNNNIPVPQVKIGDEGQIILAPESLVLKQKESEVMSNPLVHETDFAGQGRKKDNRNRTSWSFEETVKFYKSLHGMGTDFTSMLLHFPNRTRKNLKAKFKREERKNSALIDKVLSAQGQTLSMADVEKDLAADKTLRKLCIETATRKYPSRNSIASVIKKRKKKDYFTDDDEDPSDFWKSGSADESKPILASSIPDHLRTEESSTSDLQKTSEAEKKSSEEESEDEACVQTPPCKKIYVESETKEPAATFKRPVGRPPIQRKRKISNKTVPNITKKGRKGKSQVKTEEPPRIHTICLADFGDDEGEDSSLDSIPFDGDSDDCFVIETNYEQESFNCIKSVKFHVDNPDCPVEVNATIEHKDESLTNESEVDESGDVVEVVSININQLPSYLEQTGAVLIEATRS